MANILIRDVDDTIHSELKRRAERQGISLQAYVTRLLGEHVERLPMDEWLAEVDRLREHPGIDGAEWVRAAREELP
ncbi:MAG: antitoxin [Acidimicrobiia bacterium]|nr:antitoxin [Acidimicrobiia bacterium]